MDFGGGVGGYLVLLVSICRDAARRVSTVRIRNYHRNRLIIHRIEHLQCHISANVPAAGIDDFGGKIHGVALAKEARGIGHDHHVLGGLHELFEAAALEVGVMGHALHLPLGERVGHSKAEKDHTICIGSQLRVEEGGLVEIGADLRFFRSISQFRSLLLGSILRHQIIHKYRSGFRCCYFFELHICFNLNIILHHIEENFSFC